MDTLLQWLSKYSLPVAALIALGAMFLFLIKYVTEKALDNRFKQYEKEMALRLERRSRFEEKLLLDQYLLATELFHKLGRIATDLNRHHHGVTVDGLFLGSDIVPLTQVYEELSSKRYLLGSRFHDVLRRHSDLLLRMANATEQEQQRQIAIEYLQLGEEFNLIALEQFGIDRIQQGVN